MVSIGTNLYHTVKRKDKIFYINHDVIGGVDTENDDELVLMQMSDYVMTLTKTRNSSFGEWLLSKGENYE